MGRKSKQKETRNAAAGVIKTKRARASEMEKNLRARIESLTFTLGLVIGMMAGLFVTMLMLVYIATK